MTSTHISDARLSAALEMFNNPGATPVQNLRAVIESLPPPPPAPDPAGRAFFEHSFLSLYPAADFTQMDGSYISDKVQVAWVVWQAAKA